MKTILIAAAILLLVGCAIRMYGNLKCDGPCELTMERNVEELEPAPAPAPIEKLLPKGK